MKITNEMIDPQLRTIGRLMRTVDPLSSEKKLHRLNKLANRYFAGRKIKGMSCESIDIQQRNHDSKLRVCVMKPTADANRDAISFVLDQYKYAIENYSAIQPKQGL